MFSILSRTLVAVCWNRLTGLDEPVSGNIFVGGEDIGEKGLCHHRQNNISLVFQNYNLIDYLTPVENVLLGGKVDAGALLAQMGIEENACTRNVMQLSGGQQQRVAIARALAGKAPVLLADEPTGNLDEATAAEITDIFKGLAHDKKKCVIVVTHSRELAAEADIVLQLTAGRIHEMAAVV
ncbi:MAG: ATP-binding cassette domain-containing protein [Lachnospiraceae bacterium]|nr:ATP-binding cassette domain-containing protein [Lachnospiraceae bacterium]